MNSEEIIAIYMESGMLDSIPPELMELYIQNYNIVFQSICLAQLDEEILSLICLLIYTITKTDITANVLDLVNTFIEIYPRDEMCYNEDAQINYIMNFVYFSIGQKNNN